MDGPGISTAGAPGWADRPGDGPGTAQKAYQSDIVYATNNELGFDYLRDNMVIYKEQLVQRS